MADLLVHSYGDPVTTQKMASMNPEHFQTRMPRLYPVHRHINIYSVARRGFQKKHPFFKGELRGCTNGERYVLCYAVADPPQQIAVDGESGNKIVQVEPGDEAGWRVAIDILNPNNPTLDPYFRHTPLTAAAFSIGQDVDLIRFGLFPSLNNPPTEEEIARAEAARDQSYQDLVDEAFQVQASDPQNFRQWLKSHPDVNTAMDVLGVTADWNTKAEVKMDCPNCGDRVKAGIAFHKSSAGVLCIIDAARAAKAGVKVEARKV